MIYLIGFNTCFFFELIFFTILIAITIEELKLALDESKTTSEWYVKWLKQKQLSIASKTDWLFQTDEKTDHAAQIKQLNQLSYPSAIELNSISYMSSVAYDFSKGIWNRIVSVPFVDSNSDIKGVVSVSVSLNKFDLTQCGSDDTSYLVTDQNGFLFNTDKCDRESTEVIN